MEKDEGSVEKDLSVDENYSDKLSLIESKILERILNLNTISNRDELIHFCILVKCIPESDIRKVINFSRITIKFWSIMIKIHPIKNIIGNHTDREVLNTYKYLSYLPIMKKYCMETILKSWDLFRLSNEEPVIVSELNKKLEDLILNTQKGNEKLGANSSRIKKSKKEAGKEKRPIFDSVFYNIQISNSNPELDIQEDNDSFKYLNRKRERAEIPLNNKVVFMDLHPQVKLSQISLIYSYLNSDMFNKMLHAKKEICDTIKSIDEILKNTSKYSSNVATLANENPDLNVQIVTSIIADKPTVDATQISHIKPDYLSEYFDKVPDDPNNLNYNISNELLSNNSSNLVMKNYSESLSKMYSLVSNVKMGKPIKDTKQCRLYLKFKNFKIGNMSNI